MLALAVLITKSVGWRQAQRTLARLADRIECRNACLILQGFVLSSLHSDKAGQIHGFDRIGYRDDARFDWRLISLKPSG